MSETSTRQRSREGDDRHRVRREVMEETHRVLDGEADEVLIRVRRSEKGAVYSDSYEPSD